MKIATNSFYLPSDSKIGVGYVAHYLANELARRGHEVTMFSPAPETDGAAYTHRQLPLPPRFRLAGFAEAMRKLDLSPFDVLHSHGEDHLISPRRTSCHVRTVHGNCLEEAWHIRGIKERARMLYIGCAEIASTWRKGVASVAVSQNTSRLYPWIRRHIPNGVDLSHFHPGESREPDPTILFVGTYANRKRGKLLMEVFRDEVRPALPAARLWMVCEDAPEAPGVSVLGRVTTETLADLYRRAWVFCLPSSYEGFGVPYLEAMASGTPVVATPNPGAREVLGSGQFGVLAAPDELGPALIALLRDTGKREHLSRTGVERARNYSWDAIASQYEQLYESVLALRP